MSDQINVLASGTTDSVQSDDFAVGVTPVMVFAFGTLGSDTGDLQVRQSDGTYSDVYDTDGQVQLSATRPQVLINAPGTYRVDVTTRTGSWGIDCSPFDPRRVDDT
jgi:hypothetical protein